MSSQGCASASILVILVESCCFEWGLYLQWARSTAVTGGRGTYLFDT